MYLLKVNIYYLAV